MKIAIDIDEKTVARMLAPEDYNKIRAYYMLVTQDNEIEMMEDTGETFFSLDDYLGSTPEEAETIAVCYNAVRETLFPRQDD